MRSTQQFSITLPNEMAETIKAKVASGVYATAREVVAAYDALKAEPGRAVPAAQVRARLAATHRQASRRS